MSEYTEVEQPFLARLPAQGWDVIDQGTEIPSDPTKSSEAFENRAVPESAKPAMITLVEGIVEALQDDIGSIDYWNKSDKQKRTRSEIKRALMQTDIAELKEKRERVAVEIMKLARSRHDELLKGGDS